MLITASSAWTDSADRLPLLFAVLPLILLWMAPAAPHVSVAGDALVVRRFFRRLRIPLNEITDIRFSDDSRVGRIVVTSPLLGRRPLRFVARGQRMGGHVSEIFFDLVERVAQSRVALKYGPDR